VTPEEGVDDGAQQRSIRRRRWSSRRLEDRRLGKDDGGGVDSVDKLHVDEGGVYNGEIDEDKGVTRAKKRGGQRSRQRRAVDDGVEKLHVDEAE